MTVDDARQAVIGAHLEFPANEIYNGQWLRDVLISFHGQRQIERHMCPGPCRQERWGVWLLAIRSNGIRMACLRCLACGRRMSDRSAAKFDMDLPLEDDNRDRAPCERCGSTSGTEEHHWAPKHLFGGDAYNWPTAQLCPSCHREWHKIVTPNMHRRTA